MSEIRKLEGFEGQKIIVLPKKIQEICKRTQRLNSLYITDIGFYPNAQYHYSERISGTSQNIMIYCTEGKGWIELPSGSFHISPNEFLIIPENVPHKYGADDKNPWTIYWTHFKGRLGDDFVSMLSKKHSSFVNYSSFHDERIRIFDSMYKNLESGYSLDNLTYCSISLQYFLTSLSFTEKFMSAHHVTEKDVVDISIGHMQNNLDTPLTMESLATFVNLSQSHYSRVFRKKTGYSPIVYFNHLKMQRACQYLQFTTLRINEISMRLGISDPYYFSRMFTKVMGLSPASYRKKKY